MLAFTGVGDDRLTLAGGRGTRAAVGDTPEVVQASERMPAASAAAANSISATLRGMLIEWGRTARITGSSWWLGRGHKRRRPSDGRHWGNYRLRYLFSVLIQCFRDGFVRTHRITGGFNRRCLVAELKSGGPQALVHRIASDGYRHVAGAVP
jgi:hypothetical protein